MYIYIYHLYICTIYTICRFTHVRVGDLNSTVQYMKLFQDSQTIFDVIVQQTFPPNGDPKSPEGILP